MEEKTLATEIINDTQDKMNCILVECESLSVDLEKVKFILGELSEIVDTTPRSKQEALCFANNQYRLNSYTEIAYEYVTRMCDSVDDLITKIRGEEEGGATA